MVIIFQKSLTEITTKSLAFQKRLIITRLNNRWTYGSIHFCRKAAKRNLFKLRLFTFFFSKKPVYVMFLKAKLNCTQTRDSPLS